RQGVFAAGGAGREVRRFADAVVGFQRRDDVRLLVDMVAERDQVDAGLAEAAEIARQAAGAVGGVLGVGDDDVEITFGAQYGKHLLNEPYAWASDNVADEK